MAEYKAVIFDLDGTLLNTLDDLAFAVNLTLDSFGAPRRTTDEVRSFVGSGAAKLIERSMPAGTPAQVIDEATSLYKKLYFENMLRETAPYPGIPELLSELGVREIRTAVVSNKFCRSTEKLCGKFFPCIGYAVGEDEKNGVKRKPSPDMINEAMRRLGVTAAETLFVGDSEVDIQTAANAGVACVSVTWGFCDRDFLEKMGATHIAEQPEDILKIIACKKA